MVRGLNGRHRCVVACAALFALSLAVPAAAQSTGMVRGSVKDAAGKPVEGAKVIFTAPGSGPTASFSGTNTVFTDAAGHATAPTLTANTVRGSYSVVASVTVTMGVALPAYA